MKSFRIALLALATILLAASAVATDYHKHIAHSCPKNPKAHVCTHAPSNIDPTPDCAPGVDCGEGMDGCNCVGSCLFSRSTWTEAHVKQYLAYRFGR